jgi:hypothetical protein
MRISTNVVYQHCVNGYISVIFHDLACRFAILHDFRFIFGIQIARMEFHRMPRDLALY